MQPTNNKNTIHFTLLNVLILQSKLAQPRQILIDTLKLIKLPSFLFTPFYMFIASETS